MSEFCLCLDCQAGFNGGLPQTFLLEVRHNGLDLVANQSVTSRPFFKVMRFTHKYKAFRSQPVDSIKDISTNSRYPKEKIFFKNYYYFSRWTD